MNAFTVAPIFDKLQHKIECLETWGMLTSPHIFVYDTKCIFLGTKLLVGTAESGLLVYDVKEKEKKDKENPTDGMPLIPSLPIYATCSGDMHPFCSFLLFYHIIRRYI